MRDARYLYQPYEVSIETFAFCNAACNFCPYPTLERKGEKLSLDVIDDLLDQMSLFEHPFFLSPFKVNEPLLDTRLLHILREINRGIPHASIRLFSNGSTLTSDNVEAIADLKNVAHLWVSLNSVNEISHKNLMGFDQFNKIMSKLDALHSLVSSKEFRHTVVVSRVSQGNSGDVEFILKVRERWPNFLPQMIKRDGWLGQVPDIEPQFNQVPQIPCARWWELSITATGIASLCCMDGTGEYAIGSIHEKSLLELYNSPKLLQARMNQLLRKEISPCNRCTY